MLQSHLQLRKILVTSMLANYVSIDSPKNIWSMIVYLFPLWQLSLDSQDLFATYICKVFQRCQDNVERTERVLYFLTTNREFEENLLLEHRYDDYIVSFCHFVVMNLNNPRLYGYLEMRLA